MSRQLKTVAKNASAVLATNILNLGIGFFLLSLVARYLGRSGEYGHYVIIVWIAEILKLIADFGVEGILIREVARDKGRAQTLLGAALSLRWIIIGGAFLIEICVLNIIGAPLVFTLALVIATLSQLFASTAMLFIAVYKAFEKMGYETILTLVLRGLSILFLWLVAVYDLGFVAIFIALALSHLIRMAVGLSIIHMKFARVRLVPSLNIWKELLRESYPLGISAFFLVASYSVDTFVIGAIGKLTDVGLFNIPNMIVLQLLNIATAVVAAIYPVFSRLAPTSKDALKVAFDKSFKLLFVFGIAIFIFVASGANTIVVMIGGAEFAPSAAALRILACTIPLLFLVQLLGHLLISADRQGYVLASLVLCFSLNLCLDILVVPKWGFIGASWATLASYSGFFIVVFTFARIKVVKIDCGQLVRPLLAALPAALLLAYTGAGLIMGAAAVAVFFAASCFLKVFTRDEVALLGAALSHPGGGTRLGGGRSP